VNQRGTWVVGEKFQHGREGVRGWYERDGFFGRCWGAC